MTKPPFFIIGTERSGTNLLRLILNSHPNIFVPHPPHLFKNFADLLHKYGDLKSDDNFYRLINDVLTLITLHPYKWEVELHTDEIFGNVRSRDLMGIFFAVYNSYLKHAGKERWGCKSTFMIYHIERILYHCPNAKFLYLVRDGRDVDVSAKKSIFNHFATYYIANLWKYEQTIGIDWLKTLRKNQLLLIKYEEILSDQIKVVTTICEFLGEAFYPDMLRFYVTQEARKSGSLSESWVNTSRPILPDNYNKFRHALSERNILLFESIAGKELKYFSYQLVNDKQILANHNKLTRWKLLYLIEESLLLIKVQISAFFTDKNSFTRYKKFFFLMSLRMRKKFE